MNKKIVIISSGQPSANPRMVKEAITLSAAGYKIKVLYCPLSPWADVYDKSLFQKYPEIEWIKVGYHPINEKGKYLYARVRQKIFQLLYNCFGDRFGAAKRSIVLFSQELNNEAKRHKANLYIGHNLGALPIVVNTARYYHAKAAFDFEDFHPGEDTEGSLHWKRTKQIEKKYVPSLTYITAASPLIAGKYQQLLNKEVTLINNVFSKKHFTEQIKAVNKPVCLFWFSQTIGKGRGLEDIIQALKQVPTDTFSLTLLGNCKNEIKLYFNNLARIDDINKVHLSFLDPVHPDEIFNIASQYDIGLSLEPGRDLNNQIALSNKIFTYLLAGNAVIFSATPGQQLFYEENPGIGSLYTCGNANELADILKNYSNHPELLTEHKKNAIKLTTKKYNWEEESKKLISVVHAVFGDA